MARPKRPIADRLWERVDRNGPIPSHMPHLGPCWLWRGGTNGVYGVLEDGAYGRRTGTHRWAWIVTFGEIPEGLCVLHRCDVQLCCRPTHLFLGTLADNNRDMFAKGRGRPGPGFTLLDQRGEKNPQAKLTDRQREAVRSSNALACDLARQYDVSPATITRIRPTPKSDTYQQRRREAIRPNRVARKLTDNDAEAIRRRYKKGGCSMADLAQRYKVSTTSIYLLLHGRTYTRKAMA